VGNFREEPGYRAGQENPKPLLLRSKWFFVFRHSYEKEVFIRVSAKQKPDEKSSGFALSAVRTGRNYLCLLLFALYAPPC